MSDIKMSNVFDLPVCVPVGDDDELKGDRLQHYAEFASRRMAMVAAEAINSHDRLTAENEALREEVERLRAEITERDSRASIISPQVFETTLNERDQLKATVALMQNLNGVLAAHDAEMIERAVDWCVVVGEDGAAWCQSDELRFLANQLRQQAKDNGND